VVEGRADDGDGEAGGTEPTGERLAEASGFAVHHLCTD